MKNLLNFFFSFDKLFKEKLIVPFFWLAVVYFGLEYLVQAIDTVKLEPLLWIIGPVTFLAKIFFTLIAIRIISELAVALFRINDNLSPDGGKSELADIDPIAEARKAAEVAAARTREATKTVSEKASDATKSFRDNVEDLSDTVQSKAKSATASVKGKAEDISASAKSKTESVTKKVTPANVDPAPEPKADPKPVKAAAAKPVTKVEPKKRGRPAGSKNKTTSKAVAKKKPASVAKTTPKKRGPKPGSKAPRDADGNLLKKDGTPRKKPGPKAK